MLQFGILIATYIVEIDNSIYLIKNQELAMLLVQGS
jgi:hypothetical protein